MDFTLWKRLLFNRYIVVIVLIVFFVELLESSYLFANGNNLCRRNFERITHNVVYQAKRYWLSQIGPFKRSIMPNTDIEYVRLASLPIIQRQQVLDMLRANGSYSGGPEPEYAWIDRGGGEKDPTFLKVMAPGYVLAKFFYKLSYFPVAAVWSLFSTIFQTLMQYPGVSTGEKVIYGVTGYLNKNGIYMVVYVGLSALGLVFPLWYELNKTSYFDDVSEHLNEEDLTLNNDEIAMFVLPVGDKELAEMAMVRISELFSQRDIEEGRVTYFVASDALDAFIKIPLGALQEGKSIKFLCFISHGNVGSFNFKAGKEYTTRGNIGERMADGEVNRTTLQNRYKAIINQWPRDTFTKDAKLVIYSCKGGEGKEGECFMEELGSAMLKKGGDVIAVTKNQKAYIKRKDLERLYANGFFPNAFTRESIRESYEFAKKFFIETAIKDQAFGVIPFADLLRNGNLFSDPVKVKKIKSQQ